MHRDAIERKRSFASCAAALICLISGSASGASAATPLQGYAACSTLLGTSAAPYNIHWTIDGQNVHVALEWSGSLGHWAAFGWNRDPECEETLETCMPKMDAVVVWIDPQTRTANAVNMRHRTSGTFEVRQPCNIDGTGVCSEAQFFPGVQVNPTNVSGSFVNGRNTVRFTRRLNTGVTGDVDLRPYMNTSLATVFALGGVLPYYRTEGNLILSFHSKGYSKKHMRFGTSGSCLSYQPAVVQPATKCVWSDFSCWRGSSGAVTVNQDVTIASGFDVTLDVSPPALGKLIINGALRFAKDRDLELSARFILVRGTTETSYVRGGEAIFEIGTEQQPYRYKATINLTGHNDTFFEVGDKFLAAQYGGRIELHGHRRSAISWTVLDQSALAGASRIVVRHDASSWRVGDKIVIAPTGFDARQEDVVTITAVNGKTIDFTPPLRFNHFGQKQTIDGVLIDETAEVGLLTRDIKIQGVNVRDRIGGHMIIFTGGMGHVEGVEFFNMGQTGNEGRYPVHWHWVGSANGDYARNSSVWNSNHRAFVCHGTDFMLYENNVAYNITSHAFVASEDGFEWMNIFLHNVLIRLNPLMPDESLFAFQSRKGLPLWKNPAQSEWRPGGFWLRNQNQIIRDNRVAGILHGVGFFFDKKSQSHNVINVDDFVDFTNNVAHSIEALDFGGNDRYPPTTTGWGLFIQGAFGTERNIFVVSRFFAWKCMMGGIWTEEIFQHTFDSIAADSTSSFFTFQGLYSNVFALGQTGNNFDEIPHIDEAGNFGRCGFSTQSSQGIDDKMMRMRYGTFYNTTPAAICTDYNVNGGNFGVTLDVKLILTPALFLTGGAEVSTTWEDKDGTLCGKGSGSILKFDTSACTCPNSVALGRTSGLRCPSQTTREPVSRVGRGFIAPPPAIPWRPTDPTLGFIRDVNNCDSVVCCPQCFLSPNNSVAEFAPYAPPGPGRNSPPSPVAPGGSGNGSQDVTSDATAPITATLGAFVLVALMLLLPILRLD